MARLADLRGRRAPVAAVVVAAGLVAYGAVSLPGLTFGTHFPGPSLERVLAQAPGCVVTDDPIVLIETGALQRNLDLHCPVVVDASGYSYDLRPGAERRVRRVQNAQWQQFARHYLASGETSVVVRFRSTSGLSQQTKRTISSWPVLADVGGYRVRRPVPRITLPIR